MDEVNKAQLSVTVTKRNVSIKTKKQSLFGCMKGTAHISGDIIAPIDEVWDADMEKDCLLSQ